MADRPAEQNATPESGGILRSGRQWPLIIAALLAAHVLFWLGMVYIANSDPSFAVEPDYYAKSMKWDATAAQLRKNEALGWSLATEIGEDAGLRYERTLTCRLADINGRPIAGATVSLEAFHHARGNQRFKVAFADCGEGVYGGTLPMRKAGQWEFRYVVNHGDEIFTYKEVRGVRPGIRQK